MRIVKLINSKPSIRVHLSGVSTLLAAAAVLLGTSTLIGQSASNPQGAPNSPAASGKKSSSRHPRAHAVPTAPAPVAPVEPPAPEMPKWPANSDPAKPAVTWDSHGLRIDAANASLHQILDQVATATGAKVEGMGSDERVFGEYGPGEARDVLSQLLHGSGYNVLLIGDQGQGTPREIVLSARRTGAPTQNAVRTITPVQDSQDDEVVEQPEVPEQPPTNTPPPPRSPQQVMQELLQRQQQMNQPVLNPPPPPR